MKYIGKDRTNFWWPNRRGQILFPLLLAFSVTGCITNFRETHFFKSENQSGEIPNFFRIRVAGSTGLSSARYLSGYFQEDVVNEYFNEIGQPDKARLVPVGQSPKTDETKSNNNKGNVPTTSSPTSTEQLKSPVLVLLLSSNSDDIANQLGALAQSQEFTASLARLLASSRFEAADQSERRLRNDQARGRVDATLGDQLITGIPDKPSPQEVKTRLLEFVNQLAADLGAQGPFKTLDDAATWLSSNRNRLRQENRQ